MVAYLAYSYLAVSSTFSSKFSPVFSSMVAIASCLFLVNTEGIINKINDGIVILATGNLDKKLSVKATKFTKAAKEKIEALGGKAEVI